MVGAMSGKIYKAGGIIKIMRDLTEKEKEKLEGFKNSNFHKKAGYFIIRRKEEGFNKSYKRSRILIQLHLGKKLEVWELVHHKDGNKGNDEISNLEVLNASEHSAKHAGIYGGKPKGWAPVNKLDSKIINRIKEIANEMVKINYSEIRRRLEKEKIKLCDMTIKKYLLETKSL